MGVSCKYLPCARTSAKCGLQGVEKFHLGFRGMPNWGWGGGLTHSSDLGNAAWLFKLFHGMAHAHSYTGHMSHSYTLTLAPQPALQHSAYSYNQGSLCCPRGALSLDEVETIKWSRSGETPAYSTWSHNVHVLCVRHVARLWRANKPRSSVIAQ